MEQFVNVLIIVLALAALVALAIDCRNGALTDDRWHDPDYTGPFNDDRPEGW